MMKKVFTLNSESNAEPEMLSIRLGNYHFSYAASNSAGTEMHQLAYFTSNQPITKEHLQQIWEQDAALQFPYIFVKIAFDYPHSILVPDKHSDNFPVAEALQMQYGPLVDSEYISDSITHWQLENLYAVPKPIINFIDQQIPHANYVHGYSTDIAKIEATDFEGAISVDFRSEEFTIIVSKANKLLLAQTYTYESPADVLYYLLKATQQFGFTQQEVRLSLSGLIEQESSLYRELHQYFLHIRFHNAEWVLRSTDETLPAHFFTALYDLAKCG